MHFKNVTELMIGLFKTLIKRKHSFIKAIQSKKK